MDNGDACRRVARRDPPGAEARPLDEVQALAYETNAHAEAAARWAYRTSEGAYEEGHREVASVYHALEATTVRTLDELRDQAWRDCPTPIWCCWPVAGGAKESSFGPWYDDDPTDRSVGFWQPIFYTSTDRHPVGAGLWIGVGTCPPGGYP